VGQLAKIKGLKVIGLVGSDDKVDWCKNELGGRICLRDFFKLKIFLFGINRF